MYLSTAMKDVHMLSLETHSRWLSRRPQGLMTARPSTRRNLFLFYSLLLFTTKAIDSRTGRSSESGINQQNSCAVAILLALCGLWCIILVHNGKIMNQAHVVKLEIELTKTQKSVFFGISTKQQNTERNKTFWILETLWKKEFSLRGICCAIKLHAHGKILMVSAPRLHVS